MTTGANSDAKSKKDANRELILKTAQDIFSRFGYKKTTLDDIAGAVRRGKSSLYYYFESKEELFQAVVLREADTLSRALEKVIIRNIDPIEKLREYILTKLRTYRGLANFYHALENDVTAIGFVDKLMVKYNQEEIRMIKRILIEGVRKGIFAAKDLTLIATGITTAIKGLEVPLSAGHYGDVNLEQSVDNILQIICYGIAARN